MEENTLRLRGSATSPSVGGVPTGIIVVDQFGGDSERPVDAGRAAGLRLLHDSAYILGRLSRVSERLIMAVDPTGDELAAFLAEEPDTPVVMLNLLRFAEGGRGLYRQCTQAFREAIAPRYGVEVVYAGDGAPPLVAEAGQHWDAVLLVRYPSRRAFSRMVADPQYQQITHLRTRALHEAVLQPTRPWGGG